MDVDREILHREKDDGALLRDEVHLAQQDRDRRWGTCRTVKSRKLAGLRGHGVLAGDLQRWQRLFNCRSHTWVRADGCDGRRPAKIVPP